MIYENVGVLSSMTRGMESGGVGMKYKDVDYGI